MLSLFKKLKGMNIVTLFAVFVLLFFMAGCSITKPIVTATNAVYIYNTSGDLIEEFQSVDLPVEDLDSLSTAFSIINQEKTRFDTLTSNTATIAAYTADLPNTYIKVRSAYLTIREIAIRNRSVIDPNLWYRLAADDMTMLSIDEEFQNSVDVITFTSYLTTTAKLVTIFAP